MILGNNIKKCVIIIKLYIYIYIFTGFLRPHRLFFPN